ncbi:MAG: HTTM domain-containing protein [Pirellulales bacterium]
MSGATGYVRNWGAEVLAAWNRFWFEPADPATLGAIRICAGAMLFYTHAVWGLALTTFFGADGWLAPQAVVRLQAGSYAWSYLWWFESPAALWTVHVAALVVFAMLTVGLFTRVVSILAFIAAASYIGRATGALFGLDQINIMLALYLAVGPSGDAFSLDRWLAARKAGSTLPIRKSWAANIAIRLMQLHMCVIYMFAGMAKLTGPAWWDGNAMWMAFGNLEYQSLDMTWMADWPRAMNLMAHVTVFWELFYVALVWPRLTRPVMLLLAIPLHLGIAICLGMITFGLIMLVGNMAFVSPALVRAIVARLPAGQGRGARAAVAPPANGGTKRPHTAAGSAKAKR